MGKRQEIAEKLMAESVVCAACYATCLEEELGCPDCYATDCTRHRHYECRDCLLIGVEW